MLTFGTMFLLAFFAPTLQAQPGSSTPLLDLAYEAMSSFADEFKEKAKNSQVLLSAQLILKHPTTGKCYEVWCGGGVRCEECAMYWRDKNGDGKINPIKELKCRCEEDRNEICKKYAKRVRC